MVTVEDGLIGWLIFEWSFLGWLYFPQIRGAFKERVAEIREEWGSKK